MYNQDGDRLIIYASKAGAPTNPSWYHNLVANPRVTVEVGTDKYDATAAVITGAERDRLWAENVAKNPGFGEYEKKTTRTIPVVALTRASGGSLKDFIRVAGRSVTAAFAAVTRVPRRIDERAAGTCGAGGGLRVGLPRG